jgi:hypothetical protein
VFLSDTAAMTKIKNTKIKKKGKKKKKKSQKQHENDKNAQMQQKSTQNNTKIYKIRFGAVDLTYF